jgi:hypothetical protein
MQGMIAHSRTSYASVFLIVSNEGAAVLIKGLLGF